VPIINSAQEQADSANVTQIQNKKDGTQKENMK
jgi:hypothetical protein